MRIVTDQRGKRSIEVECSGCGYTWQSSSRSGKTTCPECRTRVHIPAALRREAYEPARDWDWDARTVPPPGGFFGGGKRKPERRFRAPRPLTEQQRRGIGFASEPEPPARPPSQKPKSRRASKRPQATSGGGPLVVLAAAAVMATEVRRALKTKPKPSALSRGAGTAVGSPAGRLPLAQPADWPSQFAPRPESARRQLSRTASSIAKLSCQHTVRLRGRPSELLGRFVECPVCDVKVTVVDAEPARTW